MKKYLTKSYSRSISVVEVERATNESVWIGGRRNAKSTSYSAYHDSFEDAKSFLIETHKRKIERLKREMDQEKSFLGIVESLTSPA